MIVISHAEMDAILKVRRRELRLPVRYGGFGERKRCPVKLDSRVTLVSRAPWRQLRQTAECQSSRARAVLWLVDQVEARPERRLVITVNAPPMLDGETWVVRFARGDYSEEPRLLAARPGMQKADYVSVPSRALPGTAQEVPVAIQAKLAAQAEERLQDTLRGQKRRLQLALLEIRKHPCGPFTNAKLRAAERNVRRIRLDDVYNDASTG